MATIRLLIKGKVQGVFYRASAKEKAEELLLTGWVKNTNEGAVEALVTGAPEQIDSFINWCKKGPSKAIVSSVETKEMDEQPFPSFTILRD